MCPHGLRTERVSQGLPWQHRSPARYPSTTNLCSSGPHRQPQLLPVQCCQLLPPPPHAHWRRTAQSSSGANMGLPWGCSAFWVLSHHLSEQG